MEHKETKLPVSNDKIEKYKVFYGIYSDGIAAKDKKHGPPRGFMPRKNKTMFTIKERGYPLERLER